MERELFRKAKAELRALGAARRRCRERYSDLVIVLVYLWAVIHDRAVSWACDGANWGVRDRPARLPSQSRMSRRLRRPSVGRLIDDLEGRVLCAGRRAPLVCVVDAKPLPVGPHSHDRHAAWGRGASVWAKGYKLHLLLALSGTVLAWRLTPMNGDEREMARRLLRDTRCAGYILGDANFDANRVHDEARRHGGQLVAPRRRGPRKGLGHRRQSPGRLRSMDLLENTVSPFGRELHELRRAIERKFGYLTATGGLLACLPTWARTYPRVHLWVQAKLILSELRQGIVAARRAA